MRIEIQDGKVEIRGGTIKSGERAGQAWEIRQQTGYLYNGGSYPEKVTLTLPKDHGGYAAGFYTLAPESFVVGEFKVPALAKVLTLVREEASKAVRAA